MCSLTMCNFLELLYVHRKKDTRKRHSLLPGINHGCISISIMHTCLVLSAKHTSLHGGTVGYGLIGVDSTWWLLALEEFLDQLLHLGDTCGATNQNDLVDLMSLKVGVLDDLLDGCHGGTEQILQMGVKRLSLWSDSWQSKSFEKLWWFFSLHILHINTTWYYALWYVTMLPKTFPGNLEREVFFSGFEEIHV